MTRIRALGRALLFVATLFLVLVVWCVAGTLFGGLDDEPS